ncbi:predicted protein [Naegleria gruberi]|uniref:Predicted protein n=1 Tax=Naegleria gruberi TaxID=5762 RepID=D2VQB6_NAEGR|nr:uncharacterized protein NAEGRDRAFT_71168 [Naegleria gruberi]EFC40919.1 predicted protein [Naegleria gruberi]|eukprot:XP_002673663.1 predicted protein [Naegleria gruberi strain NEG-M]
MARTRMVIMHNFYIINFSMLEKALSNIEISSINNLNLEELVCSLPHVSYKQPFYAMRGFPISEFDDHLVLFTLSDKTKILMFSGEKRTIQFNDACFAEYQNVRPFEQINSLMNNVHPIYLTRYLELCEFDCYVNDRVLVNVLGEHYKDYLSNDENDNNENENDNELSYPPSKKTKYSSEDDKEEDRKQHLIEIIKRETCNIEWDDNLLDAFRKMLYSIDSIIDHTESPFINLSPLVNSHDMIYCILEFIGNVKTLFNFAISCHDFYEIFKQANKNNLLLKRIVKDIGIVYF